ncbi:unnamed protein product [Ambrosiozyma monospora]|uniref:Unnamed protein product n=1 Tax=Ambrosiozyma monospora TaxID=43982 RepID=A0ACB5UB68_AMBMO|nr:unnamed protein product [Ambrosiozyma monospora]
MKLEIERAEKSINENQTQIDDKLSKIEALTEKIRVMKEEGDNDGEVKANGDAATTTSTTTDKDQADGTPTTDADGDTQMTDGNAAPVPTPAPETTTTTPAPAALESTTTTTITITTTTTTKPKESPASRLKTVQNKLNDSKSKNLLLVEKMEGLLLKLNDTSNRSRVSHYVNYSRNGLLSKRK